MMRTNEHINKNSDIQGGALLTQDEAASLICVSPRTLEAWRYKGTGPNFVKISPRCIRYSTTAINEWVNARVNNIGVQQHD